jgi:hypothetical protein
VQRGTCKARCGQTGAHARSSPSRPDRPRRYDNRWATKGDRVYHSRRHKAYGVNGQTHTDSVGRLIWAAPMLSGSRHDIACAREYSPLTALAEVGVLVLVLAERG